MITCTVTMTGYPPRTLKDIDTILFLRTFTAKGAGTVDLVSTEKGYLTLLLSGPQGTFAMTGLSARMRTLYGWLVTERACRPGVAA